jgi:hypothetical protein
LALQNDYTLKGKDKLYLVGHSDAHVGSEQYNEEYREDWRDNLKRIRNPIRGYIGGDMNESATKRLSNSSYRQQMHVNDQLTYNTDFLSDFDFWKVAVMGNHEVRLQKEFDMDINRILAENLGCDYGYQYYDRFTVNGELITVYIAHGAGSSKYHYTAEGKIIRDTQNIDADIIMQGHNHRCNHFSIPHSDPNSKTGIRRKHYCFMGGFVSYKNSYADAMQMSYLPEAYCYLTIDKNLRVEHNLFYIDERRPDLMKI